MFSASEMTTMITMSPCITVAIIAVSVYECYMVNWPPLLWLLLLIIVHLQ